MTKIRLPILVPAGLERIRQARLMGPSGWVRQNKARTAMRQQRREIRALIEAQLEKEFRKANMKPRYIGQRLSGKGPAPATRSIGVQCDLPGLAQTSSSSGQVDLKARDDVKPAKVRHVDKCVGEHCTGEPIFWRGLFDMP